MADPHAALTDAEWLPHRIDPSTGDILFAHISRDRHRAVTFLDDQYLGQYDRTSIPISALPQERSDRPLHFIFHGAFCCSTLLARVLDIPGAAMGLKEPIILNDLAPMVRRGSDITRLLGPIVDLLARPFGPGEIVVAKPSNVANDLIAPIMDLRSNVRAIILHAPLRTFLVSIAKKGMWGRIWARRLYAVVRDRRTFDPGYSPEELFLQTDLQIAALCWLYQQSHFAAIAHRYSSRIRTLNSDLFLAKREQCLARLLPFFGLDAAAQAKEVAVSEVFAQHSKVLGSDYDQRARARDHAASDSAHSEEIDMIVSWSQTIMRQFGIPAELPFPLLG